MWKKCSIIFREIWIDDRVYMCWSQYNNVTNTNNYSCKCISLVTCILLQNRYVTQVLEAVHPPVQQRKSPTLDQGTQHPSSSPEKSQRPQQNHPHQNHPSQGPPRGDHRWDRRPPPQHHQQQQRPQSTSSYSRGRGSDRGGFPRGGRGGMQDRRDSKSSCNLKSGVN